MKYVVATALVACIATMALAGPLPENEEVQQGMKSAFEAGLERFGKSIDKHHVHVSKPKGDSKLAFSQYTQGQKALGGGKPKLREQYMHHNYVPSAPTKVHHEHEIADPSHITPAEAAKLYVPHAPVQFTTDRMH